MAVITTYKRYTVRPTAVPMTAALRAVDTIEPARPRRRFAGGKSTWMSIKREVGISRRRREKREDSQVKRLCQGMVMIKK